VGIYPGGKNGEGVFQRIINQIPPHRVYVEPFAGSAAVFRHKRPAERSVLLDLDPGALAILVDCARAVVLGPGRTCEIREVCGIQWLEDWAPEMHADWFVYADPPYLASTRSKKRIYRHEMDRLEHRRLLRVLRDLPCKIMLSGYDSALYRRELKGWRTDRFMAGTRGGPREEWLWMNYPQPEVLHDWRYLGGGFREREKLRRQQRRWVARLERMNLLQRQALMAAIAETAPAATAANGEMARPPRHN
jgi:16S rRNA G966 N2-methylase RsmD